ncbi:MAG: hypothetical protein ACWA45_08090 [Flavobacteriales bacterium]
MDKTNEQLQNELENLRKIVFRIMDFNFPDLDANIKHYDFVTDETVRRQLELDYLKMMQTPASNFNEYCHYSFFQIENLLNYYYTIRFQSKEELQEYFKFTNDPKEVVKTRVSEIPYSSKWAKFANEFLMTEKKWTDKMTGEEKIKKVAIPLNYDIQKIAYVRNSSIHRNTIDIEKYEDELFQKYIEIKSKPSKSQDEWNIYNEGNKVEFKLSESFSLVKKRTAEFLKIIQPEILKYQKEE